MEQRFVLELEGQLAGRMFSVHGGQVTSEVMGEPLSSSVNRVKSTGQIDFEPLVMYFGTGMSQIFYKWINSGVARTDVRRNGSVIQLDNHSRMVHRRAFYHALVKDVVFPDLNKSSTKEAMVRVVVQPEWTITSTEVPKHLGVYASSLPKAWSVNHFRMEIDGLSMDSHHISKIEGLSLRQSIKKFHTTKQKFPEIDLGRQEFANITIEVPMANAKEFLLWQGSDLRQHSLGAKVGRIRFIAPGSRSAFFTLTLYDLDIVSISKAPAAYWIELTFRSMSMEAGASAMK